MIVVDSSFVIAQLVKDTRTDFVLAVLKSHAGDLHAPALLSFEVIHVLSRKQRQGLLSVAERDLAIHLAEAQLITYDRRPDAAVLQRIAGLAEAERLSGYDATYLELALRLGAELATLDAELADAARRSGVTVHWSPPA